jgi:putative mRNA 3-end processing factor
MHELVTCTDRGLYCAAGDFYVDPWRPVDRAIITHAHSDHARPGSARYLAAAPGAGLLRHRLGQSIQLDAVSYGQVVEHQGVKVSLHPAGHVLGSSQVRIEHRGQVAVVTGDYKTHPDATCAPFELIQCDHLITESTFGLPIYRWLPATTLTQQINQWWTTNRDAGITSVIYAYALGKAQRVIGGLDASIGPILLHGAVDAMTTAYREAGIALPPTLYADADAAKTHRGRAALIAPMSAAGSPWLRKFGTISAAVVSGWMAVRGKRRYQSVDRGFAMSDHADWDGLMSVIRGSGAQRVDVTHGYADAVARYLRETRGIDARKLETQFEGEPGSEADEPKSDPKGEA